MDKTKRRVRNMFCMNCGEKIPDNSKFCYKCGMKIEIGVDDRVKKDSNSIAQASDEAGLSAQEEVPEGLYDNTPIVAQFDIYGKNMKISELDRENLIVMGALIYSAKLGRNNLLEYIRYMTDSGQIKELKNVIYREFDVFEERIYVVLEENDIPYKLKEDIRNLFVQLNVFSKLNQLEREIKLQLTQLQQDRDNAIRNNELKKQNRGRLVGGGFGIRGAAKGILTASAVNAVTGSIYSLRNAFSNASINSEYNKIASSIPFKEEALRLADAFFDDCMRIVDQVFDYVGRGNYRFKTNGHNKILKYIREIKRCSEEEFSRIPELFYEILCIYPFDGNSYIEVCSRLGDENGAVKNMLEYLKMDTVDFEQALAAYRFRSDLYGGYIGRIKKEISSKKLDWWFQHFIGYGINEYIEKEGVDNIIPTAFDIFKAHLLKGDYCWYTFEFKKNVHLLQGFKEIDFTWQEPVSMYWEKNIEDDYPKEHKGKYLLITSENVYTPTLCIPIMDIYSVIYYKNAGIYINKNYPVCSNVHCDETTKEMIYSEILLLQLLHEIGKTEKKIPLFDKDSVGLSSDNIYYAVKSRFLDYDGGLNNYSAEFLSNNNFYINGYLTEKENILLKERLLPDRKENEYYIMGYWKNIDAYGIILTNQRLIYKNLMRNVYMEKEIAECGNNEIIYSHYNFIIFEKTVSASGKEKQDIHFCIACNQVIAELSGVQEEMPKKIIYDKYRKVLSVNELSKEQDIRVIISELLFQMQIENKIQYSYNVYQRGLLPEGKEQNKLRNYCLDPGERVFLLKDMPFFNKPQKKGWLVTDKGIRFLNVTGHSLITWADILNKVALIVDNNVIIDGQIRLEEAGDLGVFIEKFAQVLHGPQIVHYNMKDQKYYCNGEEIDYEVFLEDYKKNRPPS